MIKIIRTLILCLLFTNMLGAVCFWQNRTVMGISAIVPDGYSTIQETVNSGVDAGAIFAENSRHSAYAAGFELGFAASSTLEWNKTYGGTGSDFSLALVQTTDGGYALAGRTYSFGAGGSDIWLVKTDANGNHLWNRTYGGTRDDRTSTLVQTIDGGFALAGTTYSFGAGSSDIWLVKTDANGNHLWNRTYGGTREDDPAHFVVQTVDGGYALAGRTYSFGAGSSDIWLVKTDANGNHLWNRTYGGMNVDGVFAFVQTVDGGYALAGHTYSFGAGNCDFWLVKTDSVGNMVWNRTYGGTGEDWAYGLVQTVDEGYALVGETLSFGAGESDVWLVRTDALGNHLWNRTYGGMNVDGVFAFVQTVDGGYALAGHTYSFGVGSSDAWLVKTDALGNHEWNETYGGIGEDYACRLVQTSNESYVLAGSTQSFGAGSDDFWLAKTARGASTIIVPDDYSTIQEAINGASSGDTIFVRAGTYYEHVAVNKTVSLVGKASGTTIIDGNGTGHVLDVTRDNVNITNFTVRKGGNATFPNFEAGISLNSVRDCRIASNNIVDNGCAGIHLLDSDQNTISGNNLTRNIWCAIDLTTSSNNIISSNTAVRNPNIGTDLHDIGIGLHASSQNNIILANTIINCTYGIDAARSGNNTISGNYLANISLTGIWVQDYAINNAICGNNVGDGRNGIKIEGQANNNTISDNRIGNCLTGLQLYDSSNFNLIHENNITQCSDGIDINEHSTQNTVSKNTITDNEICGLQVYNAENNLIDGNNLRNNWAGIGAHGKSHDNYINGNSIENCTNGVLLHDSDYNSISGNNIADCEIAIHFEWLTNFNTAEENNIRNNHIGIQLEQTSGNIFCHNNILSNTFQVSIIEYASDTWDDGYPSGGNYWSDYSGTDLSSGLYQNENGSDGIGDTPYIIDQSNRDDYPLMDPWSSNAWDWTVDDDGPADFRTIQEAINVASDGDTIFVKAGIYYEYVVVNKTVSLVGEDASVTIIDGNDTGHVANVVSDNVNITGFTVQNSGSNYVPELDAGICLNGTVGCVISGNRLVGNGFAGISLLNSNQNTITHNNLSSAGWVGVHLMNSTRNLVSANVITDKYGGVNGHVSSNYNNITENVISNCTYGMFYHASSYNNICGNNISAVAVEGIWLQDQVNYNLVAENNFINDTVAIRVQGPNYNNTLSRNVVTGAEYGIKIENNARYTRIADNIIVNNRAGNDSWSAGIRLDSGLDSQIHSNTITGSNYGILLYSSSPRVSIYNNTIVGNEFGIRVASGGSNYVTISDNVVMNNLGYGIGLTGFGSGSNNATIARNLIVNNSDGIALGQYSNYNRILQNNINANKCGFYIELSTQNKIYSNNIVDNNRQVNITSASANAWDNGYPSGGNYWSDYGGADIHCGSYQNVTGSDGIGDTPAILDGNNTDRYPLMTPWTEAPKLVGDINGDGKVDMKDVGYVARRFMCVPGDLLWDPIADVNDDLEINMTDIGTVAGHFGESRVLFDDVSVTILEFEWPLRNVERTSECDIS